MELALNEKSQHLLNCLLNNPPDYQSASRLVQAGGYTPEDITKVAIRYADECRFNVCDYVSENTSGHTALPTVSFPDGVVPGLPSSYLYDVIKFLLPYGVDSNAVFGETYSQYNLMDSLLFVDNEYVAPDTLTLLLENGGNPNLIVDGESIYDQVAFEVWFGSIEQAHRWRYDPWVHIWFVLLAYGGKPRSNNLGICLFREYNKNETFSLAKLKDHRNYYYGLSYENQSRVVHIYDKSTLWEVARW